MFTDGIIFFSSSVFASLTSSLSPAILSSHGAFLYITCQATVEWELTLCLNCSFTMEISLSPCNIVDNLLTDKERERERERASITENTIVKDVERFAFSILFLFHFLSFSLCNVISCIRYPHKQSWRGHCCQFDILYISVCVHMCMSSTSINCSSDEL